MGGIGAPLIWSMVGVFGVVAALLFYVALFRDRARRNGVLRRRCPRCWYSLDGLDGLGGPGAPPDRCPECGRAARGERDLLRTRRHWRICAVGVVCMVAAASALVGPRVHSRGWWSLVPTSVILVSPGWDALTWFSASSGGGEFRRILWSRVNTGTLTPGQERRLLARLRSTASRQGQWWDPGAPLPEQTHAGDDYPGLWRSYAESERFLFVHDTHGLDRDQLGLRLMIHWHVHVNSWSDDGGEDARLHWFDNEMVVHAPAATHAAIVGFLRELRAPRLPATLSPGGLPPGAAPGDLVRRMYRAPVRASHTDAMDHVSVRLRDEVDTDSWEKHGGYDGFICSYDRMLIVTTRARNFPAIEAILAEEWTER